MAVEVSVAVKGELAELALGPVRDSVLEVGHESEVVEAHSEALVIDDGPLAELEGVLGRGSLRMLVKARKVGLF